MSEPKRYIARLDQELCFADVVRYSDYAKLADENRRLREMVRNLASEVDCTNVVSYHRRRPLVDAALALVGGSERFRVYLPGADAVLRHRKRKTARDDFYSFRAVCS